MGLFLDEHDIADLQELAGRDAEHKVLTRVSAEYFDRVGYFVAVSRHESGKPLAGVCIKHEHPCPLESSIDTELVFWVYDGGYVLRALFAAFAENIRDLDVEMNRAHSGGLWGWVPKKPYELLRFLDNGVVRAGFATRVDGAVVDAQMGDPEDDVTHDDYVLVYGTLSDGEDYFLGSGGQ